MELENGAARPGDYLYRSGSLKWDVESGMWGILRVMKRGLSCTCKNAEMIHLTKKCIILYNKEKRKGE